MDDGAEPGRAHPAEKAEPSPGPPSAEGQELRPIFARNLSVAVCDSAPTVIGKGIKVMEKQGFEEGRAKEEQQGQEDEVKLMFEEEIRRHISKIAGCIKELTSCLEVLAKKIGEEKEKNAADQRQNAGD
ncbi:hypothetical protein WISP_15483 [Willisornis vidua]|uniref:Uncharacterized protein n=1 Tax=Willisornis vidua TaxID=1566151 RepID=A0ABQ9DSR3_9PASS|nr:hypothetical protein WISP_15483 [Willisornis vidua]